MRGDVALRKNRIDGENGKTRYRKKSRSKGEMKGKVAGNLVHSSIPMESRRSKRLFGRKKKSKKVKK